MSSPELEYQSLLKRYALAGVAFAVCVAVSMIDNDAPATATVCQIADAACGVLIAFGWWMPLFCLGLFGCSFFRAIGSLANPEASARDTTETAIVGLGSLILTLATSWAYLSFGLGRLEGNPPQEEMWFTLSLVVGGAGLLLLQRWAGMMVCGAGWWWLWRLLEIRATSPIDPSCWGVAFLLATLVLPLSAAVIASWRYLSQGPQQNAPSCTEQT